MSATSLSRQGNWSGISGRSALDARGGDPLVALLSEFAEPALEIAPASPCQVVRPALHACVPRACIVGVRASTGVRPSFFRSCLRIQHADPGQPFAEHPFHFHQEHSGHLGWRENRPQILSDRYSK